MRQKTAFYRQNEAHQLHQLIKTREFGIMMT